MIRLESVNSFGLVSPYYYYYLFFLSVTMRCVIIIILDVLVIIMIMMITVYTFSTHFNDCLVVYVDNDLENETKKVECKKKKKQ